MEELAELPPPLPLKNGLASTFVDVVGAIVGGAGVVMTSGAGVGPRGAGVGARVVVGVVVATVVVVVVFVSVVVVVVVEVNGEHPAMTDASAVSAEHCCVVGADAVPMGKPLQVESVK